MAKNKSKEYIKYWADGCSGQSCVADYIIPASAILNRDYPKLKCACFNNIFAWDADSYEKVLHKHHNYETVDMVFGLDYGELLMVEAKLDIQNVENIKGEIEKKVAHTKEYLVSSDNFKTVRPSVVLFGQKNFNQLYSRYRKMRSNKTDIIPMTLSTFFSDYFGRGII